MTTSSRLMLFCASFYVLVTTIVLMAILRNTGGHFVYAMDDAYIHLALAENLAHGHYGINPSEFSSPSSSLLWPFLLVPFAATRLHAFLPLALDIVFGTIAAALIGLAVAKWQPQKEADGSMPFWKQAVTCVLLLFIANLPSLTFIGLEHVLQVLLAICCAFGVMEAYSQRPIPLWCLVAACIAPAVRYEDLVLTMAVCVALLGLRAWRKALVVGGLSVLPLAIFSFYLRSKGLPFLPMSVLVKGNAYAPRSLAGRILQTLTYSIHDDLTQGARYFLIVLLLIFTGRAFQESNRARRFVCAGAAALAALQLTIGRFGWFHRYEIYASIFLILLLLRVSAENRYPSFGYFALALAACAAPYIEGTIVTPAAALNVYEQQYQMHRFVADFYHGDYAVNDLGLVSFQRRPGAYVLDVFGLASAEASKQTYKSAEWLGSIVSRHHVDLAIVYADWFHIPASWTPLAKMCLSGPPVSLAGPCVVFYSTRDGATAMLRDDLARFSPTVPAGVGLTLYSGRGEDAATRTPGRDPEPSGVR